MSGLFYAIYIGYSIIYRHKKSPEQLNVRGFKCSSYVELFENVNFCSAKAFRSFFYCKFNFFTIIDTFVKTEVLNVVSVYKDIFVTTIRLDKSKTFLCIKPFYFTVFHNIYVVCVSSQAQCIESSKMSRLHF